MAKIIVVGKDIDAFIDNICNGLIENNFRINFASF